VRWAFRRLELRLNPYQAKTEEPKMMQSWRRRTKRSQMKAQELKMMMLTMVVGLALLAGSSRDEPTLCAKQSGVVRPFDCRGD